MTRPQADVPPGYRCRSVPTIASHPHFNVRGNAVLGFSHLARRFGRLDSAAREIIEAGLRDGDSYVRGHANAAADDVQHFLGWKVVRPN